MPLTNEDGRIVLSFDFRVTVHTEDEFPGQAAQAYIAKSLAHPKLVWINPKGSRGQWEEAVAFSAIEAEAACYLNGLGELRVKAAMEPAPGADEDWRLECSVVIDNPALFIAQAQDRYEKCWGALPADISIEELAYELFCASNSRPYSPIDAGFEFTGHPSPATSLDELFARRESMALSDATPQASISRKSVGRPRV
jgi:hypothetical protein